MNHFRLPYANLIPLAINFNSEQGLMRHHLFRQKKKEFLLCIFEYKNKQQNKSNVRKLLLFFNAKFLLFNKLELQKPNIFVCLEILYNIESQARLVLFSSKDYME